MLNIFHFSLIFYNAICSEANSQTNNPTSLEEEAKEEKLETQHAKERVPKPKAFENVN